MIKHPPQDPRKPIQFREDDRLLDIRYDPVFKAVFTRDSPASRGAISSLVSALIERPVVVQTITANEPPIDDINHRGIRFDISCKAESGELINIEMGLNPNVYEPVRLEYYSSRLFANQDIRGKDKDFVTIQRWVAVYRYPPQKNQLKQRFF